MINTVLIHFIDIKKDEIVPFRYFYTENPKAYLDMYHFAMVNEIEIKIDDDEIDKYSGNNGYITDIALTPGGEGSIPCIKIYMEVFI